MYYCVKEASCTKPLLADSGLNAAPNLYLIPAFTIALTIGFYFIFLLSHYAVYIPL